MRLPHRTVQVVCESAVEVTAASLGWLGVLNGNTVSVVAAASEDPATAEALVGRQVERDAGAVGFVLQSGQPMAIQPGGKQGADQAATALLGRSPMSLVCVPCNDAGDALGVLQLVDKVTGGGFTFDDVEIATLLGAVAGAALADVDAVEADAPSPALLAGALSGLADTDPDRYARVALAVASMLEGS